MTRAIIDPQQAVTDALGHMIFSQRTFLAEPTDKVRTMACLALLRTEKPDRQWAHIRSVITARSDSCPLSSHQHRRRLD